MPVVARVDPKTVFSAEEWSRLTSRSSLRGMWLVASCLGHHHGADRAGRAVAQSADLADRGNGGRHAQLGLAILMHEAAHGGLHGNKADQ